MIKLLISSTNRSDVGHLNPLISSVNLDNSFKTTLLINQIQNKFVKNRELKSLTGFERVNVKKYTYRTINNSVSNQLKLIRKIIKNTGNFLADNKFDFFICLGDRFETLVIAQVAFEYGIPIIHFHGGEDTFGSKDNHYRKLISNLAKYHFVSHSQYMSNLQKLGIKKSSIYNVGALSVEKLQNTKFIGLEKLQNDLKLTFLKYGLLTFHPVTTEPDFGIKQLKMMFGYLDKYFKFPIYFTSSNIDLGGYSINQYVNSLCLKFPKKYRLLSNLSEIQYLSLMNNAICVIGNSSSGVIEAPLLGVPSINFGNRQTGRVLSKSVLNIKDNCSKCSKTATRILTFNSSKNSRANSVNKKLFGDGKTSEKVIKKIKTLDGNVL